MWRRVASDVYLYRKKIRFAYDTTNSYEQVINAFPHTKTAVKLLAWLMLSNYFLWLSIHDFLVEEAITRPVVGPAIGHVENLLFFFCSVVDIVFRVPVQSTNMWFFRGLVFLVHTFRLLGRALLLVLGRFQRGWLGFRLFFR